MDRRGRTSSMARGEVGARTRACLLFLKDTSHCIAGCGPYGQLEKMDMRCESHSASRRMVEGGWPVGVGVRGKNGEYPKGACV